MIRRRMSGISLAVFAMAALAVLPAFAKNRHQLTLFADESYGATKLARGLYLVKWETHSPEATVTFMTGGKVKAVLNGKVVQRDKKFPQNVVIDDPGQDGSRQLREIDLGDTNISIVFGES